MGNYMEKPSNMGMVDRLVQSNHIRSPIVESAFRAVDRGAYLGEPNWTWDDGSIYDDKPRRIGNLHLSAPCIYGTVVEALDLKSGLSFLNLGSGTGYLSTIVGLLIGPYGVNHGVEIHSDVIEFSNNRLQQFKERSYAIHKFEFSDPIFIEGDCANLDPRFKYDRIYLGAACLPELEIFMKKLLKPNGGVLVMPCGHSLMRYVRKSDDIWESRILMAVEFTSMVRPIDRELIVGMPFMEAKSLKELCRIYIRRHLRDKTNLTNPSLLHSDNMEAQYTLKKDRLRRRGESKSARENNCVPSKATRPSLRLNHAIGKTAARIPHNQRESPKRGGCRCRQAGQVCKATETETHPPHKTDGPNSTIGGGVTTRSASRRLQDHEVVDDTKIGSHSSTNSRDGPTFGQMSAGSSSDSSEDYDDDDDDLSNVVNIWDESQSKTRSIVCSVGQRTSLSSTADAQESGTRMVSPPALLPSQRHIARLIEPVSSASSSSPQSPNSQSNEFSCVGDQLVIKLPNIIAGILDNLSSDESADELPKVDDHMESASDESWDEFVDSNSDEDTTSEASWGKLNPDGEHNTDWQDEESDDDDMSSGSSFFDVLPLSRLFSSKNRSKSDTNEPQPSTSRGRPAESPVPQCPSRAGSCSMAHKRHAPKIDQEPVARRLRSNQSSNISLASTSRNQKPQPTTSHSGQTGSSTVGQLHSSGPKSRDGAVTNRSSTETAARRWPHVCPIHQRRRKLVQKHGKARQSVPSELASPNASSNIDTTSTHSSMRLSTEPTSSARNTRNRRTTGNSQRDIYTRHLLYRTRVGITISLASHYSSWHSSFKLFERRHSCTSGRSGATADLSLADRSSSKQRQRLPRKRKRRASSDSSELSSAIPSSSFSGQKSGRSSRSRARHCNCAKQSRANQNQEQRNDLGDSGPDRQAAQAAEDRPIDAAIANNSSSCSTKETSSRQLDPLRPAARDTISRATGSRKSPLSRPLCHGQSRVSQFAGTSSTSGNGLMSPTTAANNEEPEVVATTAAAAAAAEATRKQLSTARWTRANLARSEHNNRRLSGRQESNETSGADGPHRQRYAQIAASALLRRLEEIAAHRCSRRRTRSGQVSAEESGQFGEAAHQWQRRSDRSLRRRRRQRQQRDFQQKPGRFQRQENECERYHNHMSGYILQLPLPRVLHSYLNYERLPSRD